MAEPRPQDGGSLKRPKILDYIGAGHLDEEEAREHARELVRHAREEGARLVIEGDAPDPDVVRERREAAKLRRSHNPS
jgi:hypothetical protein